MPRTETAFGQTIQNLLIHGTPDRPQLVLPPQKPIEPATSLAAVPQVLDTLPKSKRPYAVFNTRKDVTTAPKIEEPKPTPEPIQEGVENVVFSDFVSSLIVVPSVEDLNDLAGFNRKLGRQGLRLIQFKKVKERIQKLEKDLDSYIPEDKKEPKRLLLAIFRRMAKAWYRDELSKEQQTKESVEKSPEFVAEEKAAAVAWVEEFFQKSPPEPKKAKEKKTTEETKELKTEMRRIKRQQEPKSVVTEGKNEMITEEFVLKKKPASAEVDSKMDRPTPEAAAFFEELWNRPF